MATTIEDRLALAAAKEPRSEVSALMLEASHEIVAVRRWADASTGSLHDAIREVSKHASNSGFFEGTLLMIATGRVDSMRVARAALEARSDG